MRTSAGDSSRWLHPRGSLARGDWESVVDDSLPGWSHTGLRIAELTPGQILELPRAGVERIVVPLSGAVRVEHSDGSAARVTELDGRATVFDGPTDVLYLSCEEDVALNGSGRIAIADSPTDRVLPTRRIAAADVPVELRGGGASSRQVHNFGTPGVLDAARLIVCEVITPAGNWSSYPPHKHDQHIPGHESRLEEIYYFEAAPERGDAGPADSAAAFGLFTSYSSPAGDIALDGMVGTGDIALVPHGYHGPAVAAPGYDLYYLNVMAGPDPEREWLISDDPAHAWVRGSWPEQGVDPRLPYAGANRGGMPR